MNVTETPAQIVVTGVEIETLTGRRGFTVIVSVFDVAGLPLLQASLDVR